MPLTHARTALAAIGLLLQWPGAADAALPTYDCSYLPGAYRDGASVPTGINEQGTVAGYVSLEWPLMDTAAVWEIGKAPKILPLEDRYWAMANDINDRGQVAGAGTAFDEGRHALRWKHGELFTLPAPPSGLPGDHALALNNNAVIVGVMTTADRTGHAALWHGDRVVDLGTLGGRKGQGERSSIAIDINESNVVVGQSQVHRYDASKGRHAVRWDDARTIVDLGTLPGGLLSLAMKINNTGTVVGFSELQADGAHTHATAWVDGEIRDLGTLPGHADSGARSVNDVGVAVGQSSSWWAGSTRAVAWFGLDQAPVDLNTLVDMHSCPDDLGAFYYLEIAVAINGSGQIAAQGRRTDGQLYGAFRLTPR